MPSSLETYLSHLIDHVGRVIPDDVLDLMDEPWYDLSESEKALVGRIGSLSNRIEESCRYRRLVVSIASQACLSGNISCPDKNRCTTCEARFLAPLGCSKPHGFEETIKAIIMRLECDADEEAGILVYKLKDWVSDRS